MKSLPYDYCRCEGVNCELRDSCWRHTSLSDMGPRTPITDRYAELIGRESECYIAIPAVRECPPSR